MRNDHFDPKMSRGGFVMDGDWNEEDHPRGEGGRFGSSAGHMSGGPSDKPTIDPEKTGDARKLFQEKMSAEAKFHKAEAERTKDL